MQNQLLLCGMISFLACGAINAQYSYEVISELDGAASYAIAYHDGYVYSGEGNTLSIYDVGQGTMPPYARVYRKHFHSFIDDIVIHDGMLWIAANTDGLHKLSLASPANPQSITHWLPRELDESVYDVAFKGDTVFIANKKKVTALLDNGNALLALADIFVVDGEFSRIRGCAVKGNVLAFTVATMSIFAGPFDGVHIYDATTLQQLSFIKENFCDHEEVIFGQNNDLLHVLAGGQFTSSLPFPLTDPRGFYYVLDVSEPSGPEIVYRDTIAGIGAIGDSQAIDGVLQNDTMYLATRTGDDQIFPLDGNVFVYDARHRDSIAQIADIGVGLLHFDVTLQDKILHVASEWFGVRSIDVTDPAKPVDLGDTPTGGWAKTADIHGSLLVQANEGYGIQLFDISDPANPVLQADALNINNGFNFGVRFTHDGSHVIGTFLESNSWDGFRVFETSTMQQVGGLDFFTGFEYADVWEEVYVAYAIPLLGAHYISFVDVGDPADPQLIATLQMQVNDMVVDEAGRLVVCTDDSLLVYDVITRNQLFAMESSGDGFMRLDVFDGQYFVYRELSGIEAYTWNESSSQMELQQVLGPLPLGVPTKLAVGPQGLHAGYTEFGLYAYDKSTLAELAYFRTGLDFVFPFWWRLEDVQWFDGMLAITEYFGQTSLLRLKDSTTHVADLAADAQIRIYPNPTSGSIRIGIDDESCPISNVSLVSLGGRCHPIRFDSHGEVVLQVPDGLYILEVTGSCGRTWRDKLIVCRPD